MKKNVTQNGKMDLKVSDPPSPSLRGDPPGWSEGENVSYCSESDWYYDVNVPDTTLNWLYIRNAGNRRAIYKIETALLWL